MKKLLFFLILITFSSCSQYKEKLFYKRMSCIKQDKLSVSERNKIYPYNIVDKIILATYHQKSVSVKGAEMMVYFNQLKTDKSLFNKDRFSDYIELNSTEKEELTNIIFNYGYKSEVNIGIASGCYMPNNAILFLDKDDNLLEFIEICFDCGGFRSSKEEITLGDDCFQKMKLLDDFFKKSGVDYTKVTNKEKRKLNSLRFFFI